MLSTLVTLVFHPLHKPRSGRVCLNEWHHTRANGLRTLAARLPQLLLQEKADPLDDSLSTPPDIHQRGPVSSLPGFPLQRDTTTQCEPSRALEAEPAAHRIETYSELLIFMYCGFGVNLHLGFNELLHLINVLLFYWIIHLVSPDLYLCICVIWTYF